MIIWNPVIGEVRHFGSKEQLPGHFRYCKNTKIAPKIQRYFPNCHNFLYMVKLLLSWTVCIC